MNKFLKSLVICLPLLLFTGCWNNQQSFMSLVTGQNAQINYSVDIEEETIAIPETTVEETTQPVIINNTYDNIVDSEEQVDELKNLNFRESQGTVLVYEITNIKDRVRINKYQTYTLVKGNLENENIEVELKLPINNKIQKYDNILVSYKVAYQNKIDDFGDETEDIYITDIKYINDKDEQYNSFESNFIASNSEIENTETEELEVTTEETVEETESTTEAKSESKTKETIKEQETVVEETTQKPKETTKKTETKKSSSTKKQETKTQTNQSNADEIAQLEALIKALEEK